MILRFPYLDEPILGQAPPSLPSSARRRLRPLVPVIIHGPAGAYLSFGRALIDTGADDTIFPLDVAIRLSVPLLSPPRHSMRWRGQSFALNYGPIELELEDDLGNTIRWPSVIAFTSAPIRYPLLGNAGCLEFLDARFLGKDHMFELEPNDSLPVAGVP